MKRTVLAILALTFSAATSAQAADPSVPESMATEIAVVGDAPFAAPPDRVTVSVRFDQTAAGAEEASSQLDARADTLTQRIKTICADAAIRMRGDKYVPPAPGPLQLKAGAPITIQRTVAIECTSPAKAGKIVDAALQAGGTVVTDVVFSASLDLKPSLDAIDQAAKRAQSKAALTAGQLGVKLGPLVSAVVTEEPEGESLRTQLQQGGSALDYGDRVQHVYVSVRYAIAR